MLKKEPQFEGIGASLPSSWEGILSSAPKSISAQFNSAFDQHTIRLFDQDAKRPFGKLEFFRSLENDFASHVLKSEIEPAYRGKGLGKLLYAHSFEYAKRQGFQHFYSDEIGLVSDQAQRLWSSLTRQGIAQNLSTELPKSLKWGVNLNAHAGTGLVSSRVVKSAHLAPGRSAAEIEGLAHGGIASVLRKATTAFGSGWRGIVGLPGDVFDKVIGPGFHAVAIDNIPLVQARIATTEMPSALRAQLNAAFDWSVKTGMGPIAVNSEAIQTGLKGHPRPFRAVANLIRHERIHQAHFKNPKHSFFKKEINSSGTLQEAILASELNTAGITLKDIPAEYRDMAALGSKMQASRYENAYLFADKEFAERRLSSERLAYSKQGDRSFFRRLQAEGLTDPRRAHIPAPSEVVHAVMASGRSEVKAGTGLWSSLVRGARRLRGV